MRGQGSYPVGAAAATDITSAVLEFRSQKLYWGDGEREVGLRNGGWRTCKGRKKGEGWTELLEMKGRGAENMSTRDLEPVDK